MIKKTGAGILFLPPYSPDFNPIEKDFGNIKKIREYNEHETLENIVAAYQ
ncbi:transposase [Nitrosococcus oceani]